MKPDMDATEMREEHAHLKHREVMLKRAHGALADAGCVVPIELDRTIEHAINALAERAITAEERLEQMTRERDEARAQLAAIDTGSPCDGHRHCCADRRKLADELLRVRTERGEALAEVKTWKHDWYVAKADLGTAMRLADVALRDVAEKYERALRERDEARAQLAAALEAAP